jgi:hypothetical protein
MSRFPINISAKLTLTLVAVIFLPAAVAAAHGQVATISATVSPADLVRKSVQNEVNSSSSEQNFMFRQEKQGSDGSQTKLIVGTRDAMAGLLIAIDGRPLTPKEREAEDARLAHLINDPDELSKKAKHEREDAERTRRIIKAFPDAFLYEFDGTVAGEEGMGAPGDELVRLKFHPNPKYSPPSHVEQILTGMQVYMLIDRTQERIAKIDGELVKEVGFGWGILGHLDRGGHFIVHQGDMGGGQWEVTRLDLAFTGKALFFKTLNFKFKEVYSGFQPAPRDLTFAQGVELLKKQEALLAQNQLGGSAGRKQ